MSELAAVRERNEGDFVPAAFEMLDEHPIIEIAAGNEVEVAVNDEPHLHDDGVYLP
jgi:hypothetical protein